MHQNLELLASIERRIAQDSDDKKRQGNQLVFLWFHFFLYLTEISPELLFAHFVFLFTYVFDISRKFSIIVSGKINVQSEKT